MIALGLVLMLFGLFFGVGLLFWLGVVLLVIGILTGFGGYGWWYPRGRRGPY